MGISKQKGAGAPLGNTNASKPKDYHAKQHGIRLYPEDEANLQLLLVRNYATNKQKVIRRALADAVHRLTDEYSS